MIRRVTTHDVAELAALAARTWDEAFGSSVSTHDAAAEIEATRSVAYFRRAIASRTILVAEVEGVLIGYAQFTDDELERLYVVAEHQGDGWGRRLLMEALDLMPSASIRLQVWERNTRAIALYESVGFEMAGTKAFMIGAEPAEDLLMRLDRIRSRP